MLTEAQDVQIEHNLSCVLEYHVSYGNNELKGATQYSERSRYCISEKETERRAAPHH